MYSEVLIAKYGSSRMNDALTISLANSVGLPTKVVRPIALFSNSESIFVQLLCWPLAGQQHVVLGLRLLMFTNLKQINSNCYYQRLVEG